MHLRARLHPRLRRGRRRALPWLHLHLQERGDRRECRGAHPVHPRHAGHRLDALLIEALVDAPRQARHLPLATRGGPPGSPPSPCLQLPAEADACCCAFARRRLGRVGAGSWSDARCAPTTAATRQHSAWGSIRRRVAYGNPYLKTRPNRIAASGVSGLTGRTTKFARAEDSGNSEDASGGDRFVCQFPPGASRGKP